MVRGPRATDYSAISITSRVIEGSLGLFVFSVVGVDPGTAHDRATGVYSRRRERRGLSEHCSLCQAIEGRHVVGGSFTRVDDIEVGDCSAYQPVHARDAPGSRSVFGAHRWLDLRILEIDDMETARTCPGATHRLDRLTQGRRTESETDEEGEPV